MDKKLVNLTPHALNLFNATGTTQIITLAPDGRIARVAMKNDLVGEAVGVPLFAGGYGEIEGLPAPEEDTIFVVSLFVRQAAPDRKDLASPGELIRDEEGKPIGAKGLSVNV